MTGFAGSAGRCLLICAKGMVMGVSDSVPGVSGGTIAVVANIYDRIIYAVRNIDAVALRLLLAGRAKECWERADGAFLSLLGLGIAGGLLLGANLVVYLTAHHPEPLRAFFIGLVAAAVWMLRKETVPRDWRNLLLAAGGALLVLLVSGFSPGATEPSAIYLFACGMIAISAMLLPGLSGAFILLVLGAYEYMLAALIAFDFPVLLIFSGGCACGVWLMSRIVARLLRRHRERTYGFICGMLAGSIPALWPWQAAVEAGAAMRFFAGRSVAPAEYLELTGREPAVLLCLAALLAGLSLTLAARGSSRRPR